MTALEETFGPYGGRYVPETLIPALDELTAAWEEAKRDPAFAAELDELGRTYVGRPSPDHARVAVRADETALPQARGPEPHRRAQDQQRARSGRPRQAARQAADHRRDRRRPARRRDGDGVRAVRARMRRLHGCRGHAAPGAQRRADAAAGGNGRAGGVRHAHAQGSDERRDPRLDHERRDDALRDRLVRRPGSVSGARAGAPGGDRARGAGAAARGRGARYPTSSWPASAAARTRSGCSTRSSRTRTCASSASKPRGRRRSGRGRTGVLHGSRSSILADQDGQIADAHSISAGLDYPGVGPEHAWLRDTGRATYVPCTDEEALDGVRATRRGPRGSSPRSSPRTPSRSWSRWTRTTSPSASRDGATRISRRRFRRWSAADPSHERARRSSSTSSASPRRPTLARGRRRGRRGPDRARLPLLRPARRRPRHPASRPSGRSRAGMRTAQCLECLASDARASSATRRSCR